MNIKLQHKSIKLSLKIIYSNATLSNHGINSLVIFIQKLRWEE
jgi:hypothetical protein